jgi:hypothetical protein
MQVLTAPDSFFIMIEVDSFKKNTPMHSYSPLVYLNYDDKSIILALDSKRQKILAV